MTETGHAGGLEPGSARVSGVPVTGADAEAATLGQIGQVLLSLPHVLVDLVHALVHTPQLL